MTATGALPDFVGRSANPTAPVLSAAQLNALKAAVIADLTELTGDVTLATVTVGGNPTTVPTAIAARIAASDSAFAGLSSTASPSVSYAPVGNPTQATKAGLVLQGSTAADKLTREFHLSVGLVSATGYNDQSTFPWGALTDGKVAFYAGIEAHPGTGSVWAANTVTLLYSGSGNYFAFGYEIDFNNNNQDYGDALGVAGIYPSLAPGGTGAPEIPIAIPLLIDGVGGYHVSAAIMVDGVRINPTTGVATSDYYNRGIGINRAVANEAFYNYSTSSYTLYDTGSHSVALNLCQSTNSVLAMALPAVASTQGSGSIGWLNPTNAALLGRLWGDLSGNLNLSGTNVIVYDPLLPVTDNAIALGGSSSRYSELYVGPGGVITTSDADQKTDIKPLTAEAAATFLSALKPVVYRNAQSYDMVETDVTEQVPDLDATGAPTYDHVPKMAADGTPVTRQVKIKSTSQVGADGKPLASLVTVPDTDKVYRTKSVTTKRMLPVARAGRREHTGFLAQDIGAAAAAMQAAHGVGSGVYVDPAIATPGSTDAKGYRPHELDAAIVATIQSLMARIAVLEAAMPKGAN